MRGFRKYPGGPQPPRPVQLGDVLTVVLLLATACLGTWALQWSDCTDRGGDYVRVSWWWECRGGR